MREKPHLRLVPSRTNSGRDEETLRALWVQKGSQERALNTAMGGRTGTFKHPAFLLPTILKVPGRNLFQVLSDDPA